MSSESQIYYLSSSTRDDGIRHLQRAGVDGFVLPPTSGWLPLLAAGAPFVPNTRLIGLLKGRLIYIWCDDEHGWGFTLYQDSNAVVNYDFDLESDIPIAPDSLTLKHIATFFGSPIAIASIRELFSPPDASPSPCVLAANFLTSFGLQAFANLSFDSVRQQMQTDEPPIVGAAAVISGKVFDAPAVAGAQPAITTETVDERNTYDPRLLGTWVPIRTINSYESRNVPSGQTLTFEKDKYTVKNFGQHRGTYVFHYSVRLDVAPAEFNRISDGWDFATGGNHGVYKIEGDEMTLCWGFSKDPRPREFKASDEPFYVVDVFRKVR
jgi:uncharacterized protein (TIGR03067 family)